MTTRTQDMYDSPEPPPWDIGRPQQAFVDLVDRGEILGEVLEAGCGTGALSCFLLERGRSVLGIDLSPVAIARAQSLYLGRPDHAGIVTAFRVHSALELPALGRKFDAVVDCGLFHQFSDVDRARYLAGIRQVLRAGGKFYALIWSELAPPRDRGPRRYSQRDLAAIFGEGDLELARTVFANRIDPEPTPAWILTATMS